MTNRERAEELAQYHSDHCKVNKRYVEGAGQCDCLMKSLVEWIEQALDEAEHRGEARGRQQAAEDIRAMFPFALQVTSPPPQEPQEK